MTELPPIPESIDTPALVVFRGRVESNVAGLQAELESRGVRLRPHAKTHKSVRIARMQLAAGAAGLTVGTLGEAEVFAAAGLADLFVAYPVWAGGPKAGRVRALHDASDLSVGVDSVEGARALGAAVAGSRRPLRVLVEVDCGGSRTGVADAEAALRVARAARAAGLLVDGVFTHGGHSYRPGAGEAAAADEIVALEEAAVVLRAAGFEVRTISAGSTPTRTSAAAGPVNEIRAGTYALGDRQQVALGAQAAQDVAAVVATTVVSVAPGRFVVDAGAKTLTKDRADWLEGFGEVVGHPGAVVVRLSDYHGVVRAPGMTLPAPGDRLAIVPNHICPVVDLVDAFWAVSPDGSVEAWPVDARGRSG